MMLQEVQKQKRRVLVKIDEVANTANMRRFASVFQFMIQKYRMKYGLKKTFLILNILKTDMNIISMDIIV